MVEQVPELVLSNADLPARGCSEDTHIEFTFFWKAPQEWEGRNYRVGVTADRKHI